MMLMEAAPAPSVPRKGPLMLAPPSYVMSANKLTMPRVKTNRKALDEIAGFDFLSTFILSFGVV
jgi:hypothetical protein